MGFIIPYLGIFIGSGKQAPGQSRNPDPGSPKNASSSGVDALSTQFIRQQKFESV